MKQIPAHVQHKVNICNIDHSDYNNILSVSLLEFTLTYSKVMTKSILWGSIRSHDCVTMIVTFVTTT